MLSKNIMVNHFTHIMIHILSTCLKYHQLPTIIWFDSLKGPNVWLFLFALAAWLDLALEACIAYISGAVYYTVYTIQCIGTCRQAVTHNLLGQGACQKRGILSLIVSASLQHNIVTFSEMVPFCWGRTAGSLTITPLPNQPPFSIHPLQCTVLHYISLYCTVLQCITLYCTVLHYIALHCTVLHCITLYCTVLHCIALYCTVLHCIAL
jgi:hypothetical protein